MSRKKIIFDDKKMNKSRFKKNKNRFNVYKIDIIF